MGSTDKTKAFSSTDPGMILSIKNYLKGEFSERSDREELLADWDVFYEEYGRIIRRFAAACGMQDCDIDECSQEVWVAVVNGLSTFEHDPARARFRSWLYRIVSNKAADIVRSRVKHSTISLNASSRTFDLRDQGPPVIQNIDVAWKNELLREAISRLKLDVKKRDFRIFIDRTIRQNLSADVARKYEMNEGAVRVVDHRLRKQLQKILRDLTDGQIVAEFN